MAQRSKFQFRMRDLLWAITLVGLAIAIAIEWSLELPRDWSFPHLALFAILYVGKYAFCGSIIGAGIGFLFQKPKRGALIGTALVTIIAVASGCVLLSMALRDIRYL